MPNMPDDYYVEEAKKAFHTKDTPEARMKPFVEVVENPPNVSKGYSDGAWVMAWIWIPNPGVEKASE